MVELGSGATREVDDVMLTRFACYLIAQNGDPAKPEIAVARSGLLRNQLSLRMPKAPQEQR